MNLEDLGYNQTHRQFRQEQRLGEFGVGRVVIEHKERYVVLTEAGELEAEITGNMRFSAAGREDFPAVGDWVALISTDPEFALIHKIYPRSSVIRRQAVGQSGETQVIGTNIDFAFIVQAADRDFNVNRLERYLAICHSSGVDPVILLTKTDLIGEERLTELSGRIRSRIHDIPLIALSNETRAGYNEVMSMIKKGKTYCLLGSSGVGKSTLVNNLLGKTAMQTGAISESTSKGRHVTSHRELVILENGGILIDNPGMREVGIADAAGGLEKTFGAIAELAHACKYKDCTHLHEAGCAVMEAVENGDVDRASYENYLKMMKERQHFETTAADKKKKDRQFGKILKDYHKTDPKKKL